MGFPVFDRFPVDPVGAPGAFRLRVKRRPKGFNIGGSAISRIVAEPNLIAC